MQQEAAQELFGSYGHQPSLVAMRVVLPAKPDLAVGELNQPVIGDSHPMRVAGQIMENVLRPAERRLGIDDPVLTEQGSQEGTEGPILRQCFEGTWQAEIALLVGSLESCNELAAEDTAQDLDRQEERIAGTHPALVIGRETASGDYAMNVRMVAPTLTIP